MKTKIYQIMQALSLAVLTGCASIMPVKNDDTMAGRVLPSKANDQVLACVGNMLDVYFIENTPVIVGIRPVVDQTGTAIQPHLEVPAQVTGMIETAVNSLSSRIRFSDLMIEGAVSKKVLAPNLILSGAITEFDRGVEQEGKNLELGTWMGNILESVEGSYKTTKALTRVGLDIHLLDFQKQISTPGVHSTIRAQLKRSSSETNLSTSLYGVTLGYSDMEKQVEGAHGALRLMVNLAVAQVFGRQFHIPWNRCVPGTPVEDQVVKNNIINAFQHATAKARKKMWESVVKSYPASRFYKSPLRVADAAQFWRYYSQIPVPGSSSEINTAQY
jgi:hypothetical protein